MANLPLDNPPPLDPVALADSIEARRLAHLPSTRRLPGPPSTRIEFHLPPENNQDLDDMMDYVARCKRYTCVAIGQVLVEVRDVDPELDRSPERSLKLYVASWGGECTRYFDDDLGVDRYIHVVVKFENSAAATAFCIAHSRAFELDGFSMEIYPELPWAKLADFVVYNLPPDPQRQLYPVFARFGHVVSVTVPRGRSAIVRASIVVPEEFLTAPSTSTLKHFLRVTTEEASEPGQRRKRRTLVKVKLLAKRPSVDSGAGMS